MQPTILILTSHMGGGHLNLAQSLKSMLEPDYKVVIVNPQSAGVEWWYTMVSRYLQLYLTLQYAFTDNKIASLWLHRALTRSNYRQLQSVIERVEPQLIITTHAMLSYATARVNEDSPRRVPLVFQFTDLAQLHMTWFTEQHADAYLAPSREILAQALEVGIAADRLHLTGRPLRRQFLEADLSPESRAATLSALGFDPTIFTIFLQSGAKGSSGINRICRSLLHKVSAVRIQIILAVGNNREMAARYANHEYIRVLPFTEAIAPYMAASDIIAGKAGASFITEAFMLEKPFFVTSFIPGQETANLRFIEQHNLGWVCPETTKQSALLASIASQPALIAEKAASIRAYKAFNLQANESIRPVIDRLLAETMYEVI